MHATVFSAQHLPLLREQSDVEPHPYPRMSHFSGRITRPLGHLSTVESISTEPEDPPKAKSEELATATPCPFYVSRQPREWIWSCNHEWNVRDVANERGGRLWTKRQG